MSSLRDLLFTIIQVWHCSGVCKSFAYALNALTFFGTSYCECNGNACFPALNA